jgi:hypothetical protein
MRNRVLALGAVVCLFVEVSVAQQFWEKKQLSQWSQKDVATMLQNSPWSQTRTVSTANLTEIGHGPTSSPRASAASQASALGASQDIQHESNPQINYLVQLRSALPIRQAVARKLQIDAHYENMPPGQKAAIDGKIAEYLNTPFADRVVIQVTYTSNVPTYFSDIRRYWMAQTAGQLNSTMFLNAGGEKIPVGEYTVSADQSVFQVTFARPKEVGSNSNLSLEFTSPATGMLPEQRVLVQFKPKDMTVSGSVLY